MAKVKAERFIELVRSSGLVEKDRFNAVLAKMQQESGNEPFTVADPIADRLVELKLLTRWQANQLLEGRHKGFFLGKYRLLDHLCTGGMSSVYLAEHVLMKRLVAIKVLPKNRVEDSSYLARFHREAQAAAILDHRNIVRVFDIDNEGKIHYIVMEYIEGRDVQRIVKEDGPLEYAQAAEFTRQAAEGLAYAHKAGLIHRDVKPANLLVDPKTVIKVLDLGLARFTDETKTSLTVAYDENVLGTADYLAPEQAVDSHGVDTRADIYGLGCTMYFMLTGHPPFPEGTLPQRLMMHQKQQPPSIQKERHDAPSDLTDICVKMMSKKPEQRYQSASEVARALAHWLTAHGHPTGSSGSGVSSRLSGSGLPGGKSRDDAAAVLRAVTKKSGAGREKPNAGIHRAAPIANDESPSFVDTASNMARPTRNPGVGGNPPRSGNTPRPLPVARPWMEMPNDSVIDDELPASLAPVRERPPQREERFVKPKPVAKQEVSQWFWLMVVAGVALIVVLATLFVVVIVS